MMMKILVQLYLLMVWHTIATSLDPNALKHIANVTYASEHIRPGSTPSLFAPRMDFEQWKPLTGRGDPLRNDPTYDYEPPVLERVKYWAEDSQPIPTPPKPERKSEVLVLGVSSRKPSLTPRQPLKHHHRPPPPKYEDYSYKLSPHYPMTILVPPPLPPPGHQPPLYVLTEEKNTTPHIAIPSEPASVTVDPEHLTSLYSLQEANLIYQSSTISENWHTNNHTAHISQNDVSGDYSGWGPTTPISERDIENDTQNFIFNEQFDVSKHPYSFYRPMLSESPPPPRVTMNPLMLPSFVPTATPIKSTTQSIPTAIIHTNTEPETTTTNAPYVIDYDETTTEQSNVFQPTPVPASNNIKSDMAYYDMMGPMMSMPMVNGPDRPEDSLYAFASENLHVFKEHIKPVEEEAKLEFMQTMQPPPPVKTTESSPTKDGQGFKINANVINSLLYKDRNKANAPANDPYILSQLTTQLPTLASMVDMFEDSKTTEPSVTPMYLIIQGHSKVKSYSSKSKPSELKEIKDKDILKQKGTQQVKHLHPIKDKYSTKKVEKTSDFSDRTKYAKNLKTLISDGVGSIDLQETDLGIKYDVSDGSDVPVEIYKKGIVESDENDYSSSRKSLKRNKRQILLAEMVNGYINGDSLDEFVYNYLKSRKNETGITGMIAKAITSKAAEVLDDVEYSEDDNDDDYR